MVSPLPGKYDSTSPAPPGPPRAPTPSTRSPRTRPRTRAAPRSPPSRTAPPRQQRPRTRVAAGFVCGTCPGVPRERRVICMDTPPPMRPLPLCLAGPAAPRSGPGTAGSSRSRCPEPSTGGSSCPGRSLTLALSPVGWSGTAVPTMGWFPECGANSHPQARDCWVLSLLAQRWELEVPPRPFPASRASAFIHLSKQRHQCSLVTGYTSRYQLALKPLCAGCPSLPTLIPPSAGAALPSVSVGAILSRWSVGHWSPSPTAGITFPQVLLSPADNTPGGSCPDSPLLWGCLLFSLKQKISRVQDIHDGIC
ncbi:nascent polypeptide-associated complex subunit alpha, muscle-specific form-like [Manacus candei]|uniref:nascent polypeptide-associated complex subunit alpha, muscle-specific form-like n=1 Tax=Manacus candei TaxID=415023 RepID=UPI002227C776|nr:nascent polypeptide-associated complex subunit alpha, muscle-specific form-like [Manacus candei]